MLIIEEQGVPKIKSILVISESDDAIVYEVRMVTMHSEISFIDNSDVWIGCSELNRSVKLEDRESFTRLSETQKGFVIFTGSSRLFSIRLVSVRERTYNEAVEPINYKKAA